MFISDGDLNSVGPMHWTNEGLGVGTVPVILLSGGGLVGTTRIQGDPEYIPSFFQR